MTDDRRDLEVNFIEPFGSPSPRHERLLAYWQQRSVRDGFALHIHPHGGDNHVTNINKMWKRINAREHKQFVVITEHDFVPGQGFPFGWRSAATGANHAAGVVFNHRDPGTYEPRFYRALAPWFILLDTHFVQEDDFLAFTHPESKDPTWKVNCGVEVFKSKDPFPRHYGMEYEDDLGAHMFWSRHYGDDENQIIAGFYMKDVMTKMDKYLDKKWVPPCQSD